MPAITIFCGSNEGRLHEYREAVIQLADELVRQKITIVYGGARIGLMGTLANCTLDRGGHIIGVMSQPLVEQEQLHHGLSEIKLVDTLAERKQIMSDLADAFIALPGGSGTMDEIFQEITLRQSGYHNKPAAMLNTAGYYNHLLAHLKHSVLEGFLKRRWLDSLIVDSSPIRLINKLLAELEKTDS